MLFFVMYLLPLHRYLSPLALVQSVMFGATAEQLLHYVDVSEFRQETEVHGD